MKVTFCGCLLLMNYKENWYKFLNKDKLSLPYDPERI